MAIDKLRGTSLSQIQEAIAKALQELVGEEDFTATIHNMQFEFKALQGTILKMELTVKGRDMLTEMRSHRERRSDADLNRQEQA